MACGHRSVFEQLKRGGTRVQWHDYKGTAFRRPDGVQVGLRTHSTSGGRAIDIRYLDGRTRVVHIR